MLTTSTAHGWQPNNHHRTSPCSCAVRDPRADIPICRNVCQHFATHYRRAIGNGRGGGVLPSAAERFFLLLSSVARGLAAARERERELRFEGIPLRCTKRLMERGKKSRRTHICIDILAGCKTFQRVNSIFSCHRIVCLVLGMLEVLI